MSTATSKKNTVTPKKRIVVSYKNLPKDVLQLVHEKYPKGYSDYIIKVDKGNGDFFHAFMLETEDTSYLIKVDVKVDTNTDDVEKELFNGDDEDENYTDAGDDVASFSDDEE